MNNMIVNNKLDEILKKRIEENKKIFTIEERKVLKANYKLTKKVYYLGILDGKKW